MKKTTAYACKLQRIGNHYNAAEWLNTISKCRQYTDELIPGGLAKGSTYPAAQKAMIMVREAFVSMTDGTATEEAFDMLAHATGVAKVRALKSKGDRQVAIDILDAADAALTKVRDRYVKWGKWQILESEIPPVQDGLDVYEDLLINSTPAQMDEAVRVRQRMLEKQRKAMQ